MLQRILIGFALCTQITTLVASDMDHLTPRTAGKQLFHAAQERDQESVRHLLRANPGGVDFEEAGRYLADNHPSLIGEWLALKPSLSEGLSNTMLEELYKTSAQCKRMTGQFIPSEVTKEFIQILKEIMPYENDPSAELKFEVQQR